MDTAGAHSDLKRLLKTFRAMEQLEEVLKVAVTAEGRQAELERGNTEKEEKMKTLVAEIEALSTTLDEGQAQHEKTMLTLTTEHAEHITAFQLKEDAAKSAAEAARVAHKAALQEIEDDYAKAAEEATAALEDLEAKIASAQTLLDTTRAKFKELA